MIVVILFISVFTFMIVVILFISVFTFMIVVILYSLKAHTREGRGSGNSLKVKPTTFFA